MWSPATEIRSDFAARSPAAPVALAAIVGFLIDTLAQPPLELWWLVLIAVLGLRVSPLAQQPRAVAVMLWIGCGAAFAAWHHLAREVAAPESAAFLADEPSRPVQLEARVIHPSWQLERPDDQTVSTLAVLDHAVLLRGDEKTAPFAGRIRLIVDSPTLDLPAGTVVRIVGRLSLPATAGNPGGFDFREWLHRQGVVAILRVQTVEAIQVVTFAPSWTERLHNQRRQLRNNAIAVLQDSTAPNTARVAEALLLGTRSQMPEELREAFMESGTLHVLAISGMNVAVIWLGLVRACRLIGLSLRQTGWTVIGGLLVYAWLTDANPPIVRAVSLAIMFQVAELLHRQLSWLQGLSLAVLTVLILNPQDLFHPGAQLSFLSVSGLSAAQQWWTRWSESRDEEAPPTGSIGIWARWMWRGFLEANVSTGTVWLLTTPLIAWRFHLVSFAGFVLNVLIGPLVCLLLWSGYVWLVCVAVSPLLSEIPLRVFEALLVALIWSTQQSAALPFSHCYVAGPPGWWIAGHYGLLAVGALWSQWIVRKWVGHGLLAWINVGLAWTLWVPAATPGLTCEVLAVGHGLAVVTHLPNGRTLVCDVGSLIGADVAADAVCGSLWRHRQRHVDALIVSHADVDHSNGIPTVADRTAPGVLLAHRTFLDFRQEIVTDSIEAWTKSGGQIRLIAAGDRVVLDPAVTLTVWHPAATFANERDNVNSLVVCLEYAGRRLLFTGDLEREGLAELLAQPRQPVDVLIAPHHGSKAANPPALAAWTNPEWIAISAGDRHTADRIAMNYPPTATLLNTATRGMIRCEIRPNGEVRVTTYR